MVFEVGSCRLLAPGLGTFSKRNSVVFSQGVNWEPWKGHEFSIPFTEMKIHPQSSSNEPVLGRRKRSLSGKRKKIRAQTELSAEQYPKIMIQYFFTNFDSDSLLQYKGDSS